MSSLYIHIPFCHKICSYCDFAKVYYNEQIVDDYLLALENEVKAKYDGAEFATIYIGGGTPSSLTIKQLLKLFKILEKLNKASDAEFTIEMNVEDITVDKLSCLKTNGINRLSVGIQTINKKFFELLDRATYPDETKEKLLLAKEYFSNISLDFIYAYPKQSMDDLKEDLAFLKEIDPSHISMYSLIIEKNTKLYIDKTSALDEDLESEMYYYIINYIKELGFNHYEISNFAKEGYQSKHNQVYWNNQHYHAYGLGASSYLANVRASNTRSLNKYLAGQWDYISDELSQLEDMQYFLILGLRQIKGISKSAFKARYNKDLKEVFPIAKLLKDGLLNEEKDYLYIPGDKLYVSNQVLSYFIGGLNEEN